MAKANEAAAFVDRLREKDDSFDVRLADNELDSDIRGYVSTQAANLNLAIGRPGIPEGRLTTIIGKEAGGKSSLLLHLIAEVQHLGGIGVLIDAERTHSRERAERIGVDHRTLVYTEGTTVEGTFKFVDAMVDDVREKNPGKLVLIGWDTVSGSPTEGELKGEYHPGGHAKAVSTWMRTIHPKVAKHRLTLVIVNQLRSRIDFGGGFMGRGRGTETMIAEKALRYWSSLIVHCRQVQMIPSQQEPTGIMSSVYVDKSKVARPFRNALVPIDFNYGIDQMACKLDAAKTAGLVETKGAWMYYGDGKFQTKGWEKFLGEHPDLEEKILAAPESWQIELEKTDAASSRP